MQPVLYSARLALALATLSGPAAADEFTDVLSSALQAYEEGDITVAQEELEYATTLLSELKSASLSKYLPEPLPGWTRQDDAADESGAGAAMAMFGGGTAATATYSNGTEDVTISIVANSAMVTGIGAMITGMAGVSGGKPIRIQRVQFVENEGELQGVVDGTVMVSAGGSGSLDSKKAFLEAMDFAALSDF